MSEQVDHPGHYGGADNPNETIKVIEAWGLGFCLGNAVKYIARAGLKGDTVTDLRKAAWYLDRAIRQIDGPQAPAESAPDASDNVGNLQDLADWLEREAAQRDAVADEYLGYTRPASIRDRDVYRGKANELRMAATKVREHAAWQPPAESASAATGAGAYEAVSALASRLQDRMETLADIDESTPNSQARRAVEGSQRTMKAFATLATKEGAEPAKPAQPAGRQDSDAEALRAERDDLAQRLAATERDRDWLIEACRPLADLDGAVPAEEHARISRAVVTAQNALACLETTPSAEFAHHAGRPRG